MEVGIDCKQGMREFLRGDRNALKLDAVMVVQPVNLLQVITGMSFMNVNLTSVKLKKKKKKVLVLLASYSVLLAHCQFLSSQLLSFLPPPLPTLLSY